jgi:D-threonine aldolase
VNWYAIQNAEDVSSPALLLYPDRIEENIRRMIRMAGGVERLRPHIKTHKIPEIIRTQLAQGITRFKTATVAESEMVAGCGAPDVLLAYQPVGPNIQRLAQLTRRFPQTRFGVVVDDPGVVDSLSRTFASSEAKLDVFLDIDCGMHRTGMAPGPAAIG